MSTALALVQAAQRLLPHPELLDTEVHWYANGARGFRHSSSACRKLNRKAVPQQIRASAVAVASQRPCMECFKTGMLRVVPASQSFSVLLTVREALDEALRRLSYAETPRTAMQARSDAKNAQRQLERARTVGDRSGVSEYGTLMDALDREIEQVLSRARAILAGSADELHLPVAINVVTPGGRGNSSLVTDQQARLLGDANGGYYSASHAKAIFETWAAGRREKVSEERFAEQMASQLRTVALRRPEQMTGVPVVFVEGDLTAVAQASWAAARDALVAELVSTWDARLATTLADTAPVTVACWNASWNVHSELVTQVIEAHTTMSVKEGAAFALTLPRFMGQWLHDLGTANAYRGSDGLGIVPGSFEPVVLETALGLWDPSDRSSAYFAFTNCITAAQALLA